MSWTSNLGDPRKQLNNELFNKIQYAVYSDDIDHYLSMIRSQAEIDFIQFFSECPHSLDYFDNQWARMNVIISFLSRLPPESIGVDIGIAYGFIDLVLRDQFQLNVIGIELPENIPIFCKFAKSHHLEIIPCDIAKMLIPISNASLDFVIFAEILEHLNCPPYRILREITNCLRSGGMFILTTPNVARFDNIWRLSRGFNILEPFNENIPIGNNATDYIEHVREYTILEVVNLLEETGFIIQRISMCNSKRIEKFPNAYLEETICICAIKL